MSYNKYFLYKKQASGDGGATWQDIAPLETTPSGDSIASYDTSGQCENSSFKIYSTFIDGSHEIVPCGGPTVNPGDAGSGHLHDDFTDVVIGNCVTTIATYAFGSALATSAYHNLSGVTLPNSLITIEDSAFLGCDGLRRLIIPDSVKNIGEIAFYSCDNLEELTIGSGVATIPTQCFCGCSIENIKIPDTVTQINYGAFWDNNECKTITIGRGINYIDSMAFYHCEITESITILSEIPPTLGSNVFGETQECPIFVPAESLSAYRSSASWSGYTHRLRAIST